MIAGARVEVAPFKEDPMDFVLWKPSSEEEPGWVSPWGRGRPGWHIECSAMSYELLGPSFDIHGGGLDLQFPHHENEVAQSCCAHPEASFARYWMHNEMLQVEGKKMSKSLGNFFTVRDLLDQGVPGEVIRFVYLSTHYRSPMDWTAEKAREAEGALRKWLLLVKDASVGAVAAPVLDALSDDLNTAGAIAALHQLYKAGDASGLKASAEFMGLLSPRFENWVREQDLIEWVVEGEDLRPLIEAVIHRISVARKEKDFTNSDRLKTALATAGVSISFDKDGGVTFKRSCDVDRIALESLK
jgi:cysteinyl-tRNA synthetase